MRRAIPECPNCIHRPIGEHFYSHRYLGFEHKVVSVRFREYLPLTRFAQCNWFGCCTKIALITGFANQPLVVDYRFNPFHMT